MEKNGARIRFFFKCIIILFTIGGLFATPIGAQPGNSGVFQSVIVQGENLDQVVSIVVANGGTVTSKLAVIEGVGAQVPFAAIETLQKTPGITRVTLNNSTHLSATSPDENKKGNGNQTPSTDYPDVIGADLVWNQGITGKQVGVAILDTGIVDHPLLAIGTETRSRKPYVAWVDFVEGKMNPEDPNGHGTHIAGIIANAAKGQDGEYNGVAPDVNIVAVRVLDKTGSGDYEKVIQGIQWVIDHKDQYNIRVMNLSLYSLVQSPYWADPLNQAVMQAWANGIVVVVAAGNNGPKPTSIDVPGNNPYAITVGAFTDNFTPNDWSDDHLAEFSSAGPTLDGFVKPDLLAPGAHIVSTMMPGSYIARNHEANWVDGFYFSMAGTSQASAVVSGVTALVIAANPSLTPDQVKYRMTYTSLPWIKNDQSDVLYSIWQQGAGRLNAYDAVFATDAVGFANTGMDINADIQGTQHYEGYSFFDEATQSFRLYGYETLTDGYGAWAGGYGAWAGKFGAWAGGYGAWAGGYGAWAGKYGAWAGGYGAWAGKYGAWAGKYGAWAGKFGAWAGSYGVWAGQLYEPIIYDTSQKVVSPSSNAKTATQKWVDDR